MVGELRRLFGSHDGGHQFTGHGVDDSGHSARHFVAQPRARHVLGDHGVLSQLGVVAHQSKRPGEQRHQHGQRGHGLDGGQ